MAAMGPALPPRYSVPERIAQGGMGDVYRATDEILGRAVAIKVLAERYATQDEFRKRFLREAQLAASLTGEPYVATIYDVGENEDGVPFIVMELVPGGTVADWLREGTLPHDRSLAWLEQTAVALDIAHERGIVHRDVKPANLLLAADDTVRVSDFGIARAAGHDTLTAAGTVLGSSGYMAPEQARGEAITSATDRYSLACVAFELLTGRRPFERESVTAEAAAHAHDRPPSARGLDPSLPVALDAVFARALAKRPEERPETCRALVSDLREALIGSVETVPAAMAPVPVATRQTVVRHRARPRTAMLVVLAAALLAAGGGLAWALTSVGDDTEGSTVVQTQVLTRVETETLEGTTVEQTVERTIEVTEIEQVTTSPETTAEETTVEETTAEETTAEETTVEEPPTGESGSQLNDRGFARLQQGDVEGALPILEQAVSLLAGSSTTAEAYASYNLAVARFGVGRCDGVLELLDRSQAVQGQRREIDRLRPQVERRCSGDGDD